MGIAFKIQFDGRNVDNIFKLPCIRSIEKGEQGKVHVTLSLTLQMVDKLHKSVMFLYNTRLVNGKSLAKKHLIESANKDIIVSCIYGFWKYIDLKMFCLLIL